ncbi:MAG TPA: chorismate mutase [Chloroflexi bacterium]|nr:chorismate mutase [Chloroflexota bacterium]
MGCRGIRGAITVEVNTPSAILRATERLLSEMVRANQVALEDVASVIFTATPDLDAVYPAVAARRMGWTRVPLMCMQEMRVPGSLARCLRVLIHWNTERGPAEIRHVYLEGARALRPDLSGGDV